MKIRVTSFVLVLALGASLLAGCEEEACDPGFEREAGVCIDVRTRLVGTWTASDTCNRSGSAMYNVQIALDPEAQDGLLVSGFWNAFIAPVGMSSSGDALTIDRQEPDADEYFVIGTGVVGATGELSFDYRVTDETDPTAILVDVCRSTWTPQEGL